MLAAGPYKGTYDVTGEPCMAGLQKKGSWHATWETGKEEKGKLAAVLVGYDPTPTVGNGLTASVHFGPPDSQVMYEILKPAFNVDDSAPPTLTMKGDARATSTRTGLRRTAAARDHRHVRQDYPGQARPAHASPVIGIAVAPQNCRGNLPIKTSGESGIRTHGRVSPTRFPSVPLTTRHLHLRINKLRAVDRHLETP